MLSTIELKIDDSRWENYNLWKYIKLALPHYTKLLIIKELRLKKILVNNQISYFQYKLQLGDIVSIIPVPEKNKSSSKFPKTKLNCSISISDQIVFENSEIVIVNKKAGQIVQPSSKLNCYSLEELLQQYLKSNSKLDVQIEYSAKFVHRIDHPVSGLLIGAKTANSHHLLSDSLKNREIKKIYRAIVFGFFNHEFLRLRNWIVDKHSKVKVLKDPNNESKLAISEIKKLKGNSKYSYLEINLITGRKNQIRAQLAELGYPILGDRKYYSEKFKSNINKGGVKGLPFNSKKIALCSYQLVFPEHLKKPLNLPKQNFCLPEESNDLLNFAKKI
ncbi:tRNA pseudouridine synthase [Mycoplasma ovis str. Michigan]|uniref:RNA pseudouridylate synthase n=1 Tax=Mycoplasma ovis str. Michigan TaxID=1415773 RepID=A0ABM5P0E3_9MOLU|nr:RNA pseudouridine synthase [Mycoplasma ovis]AHC39850.1 tRNA pseudouridine synthase [Mycoplasma ovis str. Michigan]